MTSFHRAGRIRLCFAGLLVWATVLLSPTSLRSQEPEALEPDRPVVEARHLTPEFIPNGVFSWAMVDPMFTMSTGEPGVEAGGRAPPTPESLRIQISGVWWDSMFVLGLDWVDDALVAEWVPEEMRRWEHPAGGARDRYYYYDNVEIRLRLPDRYYGGWLTPDPEAETAVQQVVMRPEGGESIPQTPHTHVVVPSTPLDDPAWEAADRVFLEVGIPWAVLGIDPEEGVELDLEIVAPDMDSNAEALTEREGSVKWLSWRGVVRLDG